MGVLDDMLDTSLDDVAAAGEYVDIPAGEYVLEIVSADTKEYEAKNGKPAAARVIVAYKVVSTIGLADANKSPADAGSLFSEGFNIDAKGMPFFKRYLMNIFGDVSGTSLRDSITALKGLNINAIVKVRAVTNVETGEVREYPSTTRQSQV